MFEAHNSIPLTDEAINAFHAIRDIKVWGTCCKCKKRIEMFWDDDLQLDGNFMANAVEFSEVFEANLPWFDELICGECWHGRK